MRDERRHGAHHLAGRGILHGVAVDDGPDVQVLRIRDLVRGHDDGPVGENPSKDLQRDHCASANWMSRAVMSFTTV